MLTRKQRAVMRLIRDGVKPGDIVKTTCMSRQAVYQLIRRAKGRIRANGIDPEKALKARESDYDLVELLI